MTDPRLERLCRHLGLDAGVADGLVASYPGAAVPWYLRVAIAIGAWLTSAALILAVGVMLGQVFLESGLPLAAAGLGTVIAAAAVALHRGSRGAFQTQCAVAAALAGQALMVGGLGFEAESVTVAAIMACAVAAVLAAVFRDQELQFLSCALAIGAVLAALLEAGVPQAGGVLLAATLPAALLLLLRPPAGADLRGLSWALLLVPQAALALPEVGVSDADWLPRAGYAAGLVATLALLSRVGSAGSRFTLAAGAAVAVLLGAVASAGVIGSLLLLALGYLLGSRMLAGLGIAAHVWFVGRFYYDLELTLLVKSGMLVAAGLLLLTLWWVWRRSDREIPGDG